MSVENVELPEIGEGVNEGELVSWLVKPGDKVDVDQAIAELMTDKATVEVPSPIGGIVKELKFSEGDTIEVGSALISLEAVLENSSENLSEEKPSAQENGKSEAPSPAAQPKSKAENRETQVSLSANGMVVPSPAEIHVLATPSTRRLAREMSIDINNIQGTGLAGRVTREDVLQQQGAPAATPTKSGMQQGKSLSFPVFDRGGTNEEERVPLKGIRKKIAENMQMAKRIVPHFTLMDEANVTELIKLRSDLKPVAEKMGTKITYLPFVMKALMATVREFPKFNGMIDDEAQEIVYKKYFNIGFAADTPNGLLVPVIKQADRKTIFQLSEEIIDLATRARDGKLALDEMKGACFTITNIGSVGGTYATPIINHPEVAIFGMYKIQERPIILDGELDVAHFMNFTVTCDHRLIDGAEAARFLSSFIQRIESPGRLMMDMI